MNKLFALFITTRLNILNIDILVLSSILLFIENFSIIMIQPRSHMRKSLLQINQLLINKSVLIILLIILSNNNEQKIGIDQIQIFETKSI